MDPISRQVLEQQITNVVKESKKTIIGSLILAILFMFILSDIEFNMLHAIVWFITLLAALAFRVHINARVDHHLKATSDIDLSEIINYYKLTVLGVGLLWGWLFFQSMVQAPPVYDFIILAIVIGFVGSAILSTGAIIQFYLFMNAPIALATLTALSLESGHLHTMAIFVALLAFFFIFVSAIRYGKYFVEQQIRHFELIQTKNEIIQALGRAGEYRDEETGNHILRMSYTCYLMAKELGFSEKDAKKLQQAASMHDVGKIGIPDHILLKKGKLTDEEFTKMKEHTTIGWYILGESRNELVKLAKKIAITHHEKWDGSGYPNALTGEAIPIEGRIAAISDVFDALTSERPYKKAWPAEEAVNFIKAEAGHHFDPSLIPIFLKVMPQVLKYKSDNHT